MTREKELRKELVNINKRYQWLYRHGGKESYDEVNRLDKEFRTKLNEFEKEFGYRLFFHVKWNQDGSKLNITSEKQYSWRVGGNRIIYKPAVPPSYKQGELK